MVFIPRSYCHLSSKRSITVSYKEKNQGQEQQQKNNKNIEDNNNKNKQRSLCRTVSNIVHTWSTLLNDHPIKNNEAVSLKIVIYMQVNKEKRQSPFFHRNFFWYRYVLPDKIKNTKSRRNRIGLHATQHLFYFLTCPGALPHVTRHIRLITHANLSFSTWMLTLQGQFIVLFW